MIPQREADLRVLISIFTRTGGPRADSKLVHRVRNSFTAGGYLNEQQFDSAIQTLRRLGMINLEGEGREQSVSISGHGQAWLMSNFHWVQNDTARLEPNDPNWVMTSPSEKQDKYDA